MVRLLAPALLMTALGIAVPLAVIHAQSTATPNQREADTAWAKHLGAWAQTKGEARRP